jgi:hypothetical protein
MVCRSLAENQNTITQRHARTSHFELASVSSNINDSNSEFAAEN